MLIQLLENQQLIIGKQSQKKQTLIIFIKNKQEVLDNMQELLVMFNLFKDKIKKI